MLELALFFLALLAGPMVWAAVLLRSRARESGARRVPGAVLALSFTRRSREPTGWLAFLKECRTVLVRLDVGLSATVAPAYIASMKLRTPAARIVARAMVVRLTERALGPKLRTFPKQFGRR